MNCFGRNTKWAFIIPEKKVLPGHKLIKNRATLLLFGNSRDNCKVKPLLVVPFKLLEFLVEKI